MRERFTIEVVSTDGEIVTTSPEYDGLRGVGPTLATSLARLGDAIAVSQQERNTRSEGDETTCANEMTTLNWTNVHPVQPSSQEPRTVPRIHGAVADRHATPTGKPILGALEWIRDNADEYAGRWVAVADGGRLVAHSDTFDGLAEQLETFRGVLVTQVT
jgi:hypothetical protein